MLNPQSEYFVARAIEEREIAEVSANPSVRNAHLQMAAMYEFKADGEVAPGPDRARTSPEMLTATATTSQPGSDVYVLDMGEASRAQGFRQNGCR